MRGDNRPFKIKLDNLITVSSACIILSKDKPSKYIPFSSAKEFIEYYFEHRLLSDRLNTSDMDLNLIVYGGVWLKHKDEEYVEVTHISNQGLNGNTTHKIEWQEFCKWIKELPYMKDFLKKR